MPEKKTTTNLNLPLIQPEEYSEIKIDGFIQSLQGDIEGSAFNVIDAAFATKQDKIEVNPLEVSTARATTVKIDGVVYKLAGDIEGVDDAMSSTSKNPVQNKVIYAALQSKPSTSEVQAMIDSAIASKANQGY